MTSREKEELKAVLEELPKEQLVQKLIEQREENQKLTADLRSARERTRQLKLYFDWLYKDQEHFLNKTLKSRYEKCFKLEAYLKILWRICSTEEEQGFCFSPAHKRFIRSVDAAVVTGKFAFEPGEEQDKKTMEQAAEHLYKELFNAQLDNLKYYKSKAEALLNEESLNAES